MKTVKIIILLNLMIVTSLNAQNLLTTIKSYDATITDKINHQNKLLLISAEGCGYCEIALKRLREIDEEVQIIVIEYASEEYLIKLQNNYNYIVLNGNKIENLEDQKFFPKLYLYDKNDKLIWKKGGWHEKNIEKIRSKI